MRKLSLSIAVMIGLLAASAPAFAQSKFAQTHPRRRQVNSRLANQNSRIHNEVKEGEMSRAKAARLHQDDRQIRNEERRMASRDNGHITRYQQAKINRQQNAVSRRIGS